MGLALAAAGSGGCAPQVRAWLWADTATATGALSTRSHQWAYDGEPVTFDLVVEGAAAHYVVFSANGDDVVVEETKALGRYRWTHVFHAGPEPQEYRVYAAPLLVRGRRDWIYDKDDGSWYLFPGGEDKPDVLSAREQVMRITCYRREINVRVKGRGGPPRRVEMALVKADGGRVSIPPRRDAFAEKDRGFLLLGPDKDGAWEITYAPTYQEVSRAGTTRLELLVEHADGSLERMRSSLDTP